MPFGELANHPHGQAMANFGHRLLPFRQWADGFVVNQQAVCVLNLEIMRVRGLKLDDATFHGVLNDFVQCQP